MRREPHLLRCKGCGGFFESIRRRAYCAPRCRPRQPDNPNRECERADCTRPVRAKGLCANHYNKAKYSWRELGGNPETRRKNLRKKTQRRRALTSDPDAESIDRDEIGGRDGWRCGLCGKRVDRRLTWPNPRSASLDHIVPLSRGGKHDRQNVQISHLSCNVAKGNRGGGEQLFLVG